MYRPNLTVYDWVYEFQQGKFNSTDLEVLTSANWCDWFCSNEELLKGTKEIGEILTQITSRKILDDCRIILKNVCSNKLFNMFYFQPFKNNRLPIMVEINDGYTIKVYDKSLKVKTKEELICMLNSF